MKKNMNNSNRYKKTALIGLTSGLLILIAVNVISSFLFFRIDLTKDKRHSLSPATIELLDNLKDKVYIRVYLKGEGHPADYQLFAEKTKDILQEFRSYSGNIFFEFIDPVAGKSKEEANAIFGEFYKKGLKPIPISKENSSGYSTQFVVPGAMISYSNHEYPVTLVVADPGGNSNWLEYSTQELEYNIVAGIRKLTKPKKVNVAFLDGQGELDFLNTSWMAYQLQRFYNVERISIDGKINSLRKIAIEDSVKQTLKILGNKYDVLIVAQPTLPFREVDKFLIDQHIMRGGKVLWLIDATTAAMDSLQTRPEFFATARSLRLNDMFFKYGVRLNANLIQDLSCQSIPIEVGRIGDQPQYKFMAFPYALNVVNFSDHPIVRNMKNIKADFTGSIDFVGNDNLKKTVLMSSSERTKLVPTPSIVTLNVGRTTPNMEEYAFKYQPIAVLVEGKFSSAYDGLLPIEFDTIKEFGFISESPSTRQIFVSDGDIIRNFIDRKSNQPYPAGYDIYSGTLYDNSEFIMNCVNYLCADDDLLAIRAKNFKIGSLNPSKVKEMSTFYAVVNIVVPLFLITVMGIIMIIIRKVKYSRKAQK
jgi:ABC-2 type transport system permease protein